MSAETKRRIMLIAAACLQVAEDVELLKKQVVAFGKRAKELGDRIDQRKVSINDMVSKGVLSEEQGEVQMRERNEWNKDLTALLLRLNDWIDINGAALDRINEYESNYPQEEIQAAYDEGRMPAKAFLKRLMKMQEEWVPLCNAFIDTRKELITFEAELSELKHKMNSTVN